MHTTPTTVDAILTQFDQAAQAYHFPMLDNGYTYPIDVQLTAYRDATRWAVVLETIGFHYRLCEHSGIWTCLHIFGNCLAEAVQNKPIILSFTSDGPGAPTFTTIDDDLAEWVHPDATTIRFRTTSVVIPRDEAVYQLKGVVRAYAPRITIVEALRSLMPEYRHLLLTTPAEQYHYVPHDLPVILQLADWHHPDLADGELPSATDTFRMLAEVLVTGDPGQYVPQTPPNTHWRYWPMGGMV
jgi:hypothetical protein